MESHETNRRWWDEVTPVHARSPFYRVDEFLAGQITIDPIEQAGAGDVAGKTLLHLQCHFGLATLNFARLGAQAVGVDFSEVAIEKARELAKQSGLAERARFVCADVLELDRHLEGQFDVVFTSYGVLTWLSDLSRWGRIVARFLRPGGRFFIAEIHPTALMLEEQHGVVSPKYDYFHHPEGIVIAGEPDYADPSYLPANATREWQWPLADIFQSLEQAGLAISDFREYPFSCFQNYPMMTQGADRYWHLPEGHPRLPFLFSLTARHKTVG